MSRHEYTAFTTQAPELHDFAHALYDIFDANGDHHVDDHDISALYGKMDKDG